MASFAPVSLEIAAADSLPSTRGRVKFHTTMEQVCRPQNGQLRYDAHAWAVNTATGEAIDFAQDKLEFARKMLEGEPWLHIPFPPSLQGCIKRHYGNKFKKNCEKMLVLNREVQPRANIELADLYSALVQNAESGSANRTCLQSAFAYKKLMDIEQPELKTKVIIGVLASKCPSGAYFVPFGAEDDDEMIERLKKKAEQQYKKEIKTVVRRAKRRTRNRRNEKVQVKGVTHSRGAAGSCR